LLLDGYIGWVSASAMKTVSPEEYNKWAKLKKAVILSKTVEIKDKPNPKSQTLRIGFIGSKLPVLNKKNGWKALLLPGDAIGWVLKKSIDEIGAQEPKSVKKILKTANIFLGSSYLWGGRTPFGIDCSGFVQTVFRLNGYELPRDSGLQFKCGIDVGKDFSDFKAGDLLFFGSSQNKISHVAIYTGEDMNFIHSSGYVHFNSLDERHLLFDERLSKIFIGAKRIIN
jgi:cell wall-associated NlpC family hydrolase